MQMGLGMGLSVPYRGLNTLAGLLFNSGAQGFIFDPTDITTLYQDRAGTTPVTAAGQSVGLRLDKSKGLALGAELVTNGDFTDPVTTGWTATGSAVLSVVSGRLRVTNGAVVTGGATYVFSTVAGRSYKWTYFVDAATSGGVVVRARDNTTLTVLQTATFTTSGSYSVIFVAQGSTTQIQGVNTSNTLGIYHEFDNISVRELAGNHEVAINDAARGIYGWMPKTGRRNLLTYTEQFDNAVWDKGTGGSISANSVVAPDGTVTADTYTWATSTASFGFLAQYFSGQNPTQNFTFSIWLKRPTGSGSKILQLRITDVTVSTGTSALITITDQWQKFSFTRASATNTGSIGVGLGIGGGGTIAAGDILEVWGAQLEIGSNATAYQRVNSQYDVTEAGVPSCYYVLANGVNTAYVTPTITPGTDKVQVFAGVRRSDNVGYDVLIETSTSFDANNGTATIGSTAQWIFGSKGTAGTTAAFSATAPITNVITGLGDISGDRATLRVNGTQVAQSTSDQGTGNYLAYPAYIYARGGTSLPFNGYDFGHVVRFGPNLDAATIARVEALIARNTPEVTL